MCQAMTELGEVLPESSLLPLPMHTQSTQLFVQKPPFPGLGLCSLLWLGTLSGTQSLELGEGPRVG